MTTVQVNDPSLLAGLSPFNWLASGSSFIQSIDPGAYCKFNFNGTSLSVNIDLSQLNALGLTAKRYPVLQFTVDGSVTSHQINSTDYSVAIASGLSDTSHNCLLWLMSTDAYSTRWPGDMSLKVTGFYVDDGKGFSTAGTFNKTMIAYGDSITEGAWVLGPPTDQTNYCLFEDSTASWAKLIADYLGCEYGNCAFGGQGWDGGFGTVPSFPNTYELIFQGHQRAFNNPTYVFVNMGTNGGVSSPSTVTSWFSGIRTDAGASAYLYMLIPFDGNGRTNITAGYFNYTGSSLDNRAILIDLGPTGESIASNNSTDGVHLNATGHLLEANLIKPLLLRLSNLVPARLASHLKLKGLASF